jgi:predicted phosphodiesterase
MTTKTTVLTVADLHRSTALLEALREAVVEHKPDIVALVGNFLHGFDDNRFRVSVLGCAKLLSQLPCPEIGFVRGNREDEAWLLFAEGLDGARSAIARLARRGFYTGTDDDRRFSVLDGR